MELAEDVASVYRSADTATKRGYNQAFFKKPYVIPEWDDAAGQTIAQVSHAELSEPYAAFAGR